MKNALVALVVLFLIACNSFDTNTNSARPNANIVTDLPKGSWKISYFFKDRLDRTNAFSGFTFRFESNGTVIVTSDGFNESGTWAYKDLQSGIIVHDSTESNEKLILSFPDKNIFGELSDNWQITMASTIKTELFGQSSGNDHMQFLTFSKI